jgi:hypothetical protein
MKRRAAVLGLGVALAGAAASQGGEGQPAAPRYLLLLNEDASYDSSKVPGQADRVGEYQAWAASLGERGKLAGGEKLKDEGTVLHRTSMRAVSPSELPAGKPGGLAGYFIISAADAREALEIAKSCPHLKYGGTVVVRPIEDLQP